jgi:hypothetical protein
MESQASFYKNDSLQKDKNCTQPKSILISRGHHSRNEDNLAGGMRESKPSFLALHSHGLLFVSGAGSLHDPFWRCFVLI